jgi:antitoxin component YwqK of YwqJK toxin-antitoxin module
LQRCQQPESYFSMATNKVTAKFVVNYHKDGTTWSKGKVVDGLPDGYWEWFRKDGIIMRSGYFEKGKQMGEWTTSDKLGTVYKVTQIKNAK